MLDCDSDDLTVLVVDDHRSFGELLSAALNLVPGMRCVGVATSAAEGVVMAVRLRPRAVVMDIQMPHQNGLSATRQICDAVPGTVVAIVTAHKDSEWVSRAAQAGASAYIPKDGSLSEIVDVLRRARPNQMLVAPSVFGGFADSIPGPRSDSEPMLTPRELDVLRLLGQGMTASGIAHVLNITLHTARGYFKSLYSKLGVRSQLEAVVKAQQLRLIASADDSRASTPDQTP